MFPRDQEQLIPNGDHDPQLSAVVSVSGIQVATWEEERQNERCWTHGERLEAPGRDTLVTPVTPGN